MPTWRTCTHRSVVLKLWPRSGQETRCPKSESVEYSIKWVTDFGFIELICPGSPTSSFQSGRRLFLSMVASGTDMTAVKDMSQRAMPTTGHQNSSATQSEIVRMWPRSEEHTSELQSLR